MITDSWEMLLAVLGQEAAERMWNCGFDTIENIECASDDDLLAVADITPQSVLALREWIYVYR